MWAAHHQLFVTSIRDKAAQQAQDAQRILNACDRVLLSQNPLQIPNLVRYAFNAGLVTKEVLDES